MGFQNQRLELKLSGHVAFVHELILLFNQVLDLNELRLEVFRLQVQLADTFVQLQQPLLVLVTELLWCRLLWILEDPFDFFKSFGEIHFSDFQLLYLLLSFTEIILLVSYLRLQLKFS